MPIKYLRVIRQVKEKRDMAETKGIGSDNYNYILQGRTQNGIKGSPKTDFRSASIWTSTENSVYLNDKAARQLSEYGLELSDEEALNIYICKGHSDYYTKKDETTIEKFTHNQRKEIENTAKEIIKNPNSINMKNLGSTLKLIDDSRDSGKNKNAAKLQAIVNDVVSKSDNFKNARIFDGTEENQEPPELIGMINAEDAQRYYNSAAGKKALEEIGATDVKTQNEQTTAIINGEKCKLEMNEDGILRFSSIKENGAVATVEYELREKPVIPAKSKPTTPTPSTPATSTPATSTPVTNQPQKSIDKGKTVTYRKMQDQNGAAFGDARSNEAQNLEDSTATRLNEQEGRAILKKYAAELGINPDDYEFINTGNPSFKKKGGNEFISINNKGQIIRTITRATENTGEYEFTSQEYKYNIQTPENTENKEKTSEEVESAENESETNK